MLVVGVEHRRVRADHDALHLALPRPRRQADRRRSADDADHPQRRPLPAGAPGHRPRAASSACCTSSCATAWRTATSSTRTPPASRRCAESVAGVGPADRAREDHRRAARRDREGGALDRRDASARWCIHARGIEHQSKGVENCLAVINLALATGNIGREGAGCMMITGQGNGQGGREHGQKCDQLPGQRSITDPAAPRARRRRLGHRARGAFPQAGLSARGDHGGDPPRRDQGAALDLLQPAGLAARRQLHARGAGEAGVLRRDRLLPLRDRAPRRRRARRQPAGGGRGRRRAAPRAACMHIQQGGRPAGRRLVGRRIICDLAQRLGKGQYFPYPSSRARSSTSCAWPRAAASPTTTASPTRGSTSELGVFWPCPTLGPSRHAAAVRGRPLLPRRRQGALPGHRVARARRPVDERLPAST